MSDSQELARSSETIVIVPLWLKTVPEAWQDDYFTLSHTHSISCRWGNA